MREQDWASRGGGSQKRKGCVAEPRPDPGADDPAVSPRAEGARAVLQEGLAKAASPAAQSPEPVPGTPQRGERRRAPLPQLPRGALRMVTLGQQPLGPLLGADGLAFLGSCPVAFGNAGPGECEAACAVRRGAYLPPPRARAAPRPAGGRGLGRPAPGRPAACAAARTPPAAGPGPGGGSAGPRWPGSRSCAAPWSCPGRSRPAEHRRRSARPRLPGPTAGAARGGRAPAPLGFCPPQATASSLASRSRRGQTGRRPVPPRSPPLVCEQTVTRVLKHVWHFRTPHPQHGGDEGRLRGRHRPNEKATSATRKPTRAVWVSGQHHVWGGMTSDPVLTSTDRTCGQGERAAAHGTPGHGFG